MIRLTRLIPIALLVAACAGAQTADERRCELAALHGLEWPECLVVPPDPVCGNGILEAGEACDDGNLIDGDGCNSVCTIEQPPPTGQLADSVWTQISGSAQNSIFVAGVDDALPRDAWGSIQGAWGGGVCVEDQLVVWGGGHGDGIHNGVLAMDVNTGAWERITEPSVWDGCETCKAFPDGRPIPGHTYYTLAYDAGSMYVSGGSALKNSPSTPPNTWRFDFAAKQWTALALNPIATGHGGADLIDGKYYFHSGQGFRIYDTAEDTWTDPPGNAPGIGGQVATVYDPEHDRIYFLGRGFSEYIPRSGYGDGKQRVQVPLPPAIVQGNYPGALYYAPEKLILLWDGGRTITTLDPEANTYGAMTLAGGDPGAALPNGTMRRFSYCGGRVVLVNGVDKDAFYLAMSDPTPPPDPEPPPLPVASDAPYYVTPPGDALVEQQCGPLANWDVADVMTNEDVESLRGLRADSATIVRIHYRVEPYPEISVKGKRCLKIVGVGQEKPHVADVNATRSFRGTVRDGGIIIENLRVSPGLAELNGVDGSGVCLGVPNDQRFFIVRDVDVSRCATHAFITSHAHQLYVEIGRSTFTQASSHLAYIDHIAMAYVYDSKFYSPGWGHALRCIALRCVIDNTEVSNVELDGSQLPDGGDNPFQTDLVYRGMAPLEVYTCGESEVRNVKVTFRAADGPGYHAAILRGREAFETCDIGRPEGGQWTDLPYGAPGYDDETYPLVLDVDGMTVDCVEYECSAWDTKGNYPTMGNAAKSDLSAWLKDGAYATWDAMIAAMPTEAWKQTAALATSRWRASFLKGSLTEKVPLPVGPTWRQRSVLKLKNVTVNNGNLLRDREADTLNYCYGELSPDGVTCPEQWDGRTFRQSFVEVQ